MFCAYLKANPSPPAITDIELSVMQSPVVVDPFKNERKLRKYEGDETLLERRKKAKLTIVPNFWAEKWWPRFTRYVWNSIMSPPLPNMRTFEAMVVRIEQELVLISEAIVAEMGQELAYMTQAIVSELLDTMQALVDELEEEFMRILVDLISPLDD